MTISSTYGLNLALTNGLSSQQNVLGLLSEEIASNQQHDNLTDYSPTDARNIVDLQNLVTQRQSYLASIQTVQTRLSVYDSTMTDIESINTQASSMASQNASYDPSTADNIQQFATDYLRQLGNDLNETVGGRYIYAGTRYSTAPVGDLTSLTNAPTTTTTTSPALPTYDTNYSNNTSVTVSANPPTGNFTIGGVSISWADIANGSVSSVDVGGTATPVTITGLTSPAASTSDLAANVSAVLSQLATAPNNTTTGLTGLTGLTSTSSGSTVSFNFNGNTPLAVTPDDGGQTGETAWAGTPSVDGTVSQTPNSSTAAYTSDSALIDQGYNVSYGVSSNDPSFQKLVNGLRFIVAAVTAGKNGDTDTYKADMAQASSLLSASLTGVQTLHAQVANNQNLFTAETKTQNSNITALQTQLSGIQSIDLTTVGAEINTLQTQLQASYSATSSLEKLSLVKYL